MNIRCLSLALAALACGAPACAQSTLGEILDRGATRMTREEWMAKLPLTVTDQWPPGRKGETQFTYSADGTLSGFLYDYASAWSTDAKGTWTIDDSGKVCTAHRNLMAHPFPDKWEECSIRFKLGDQYFRIVSEPVRTAKLIKSFIQK